MKPLRSRSALLVAGVLLMAIVALAASRALTREASVDAATRPVASETAPAGSGVSATSAVATHPAPEAPAASSPAPLATASPHDGGVATLPTARASVPAAPRVDGRPPKTKKKPVRDRSFEGDRLPIDSPYDLPPMVELRVGGSGPLATTGLRGYVLRLRTLALSPAARAWVRSGRAPASTLETAARLSRATSPLLVHRARPGRLRVQATSLEGTRSIVAAARSLSGISVSLRPVRRDFADVAQSAADIRASDIGAKVVALALAQVGMPYSWGGGNANGASTGTCAGYTGSILPCPATRTVGFDCSGLTLYAYAQVGITLDHYAAFQWLEGRRIASNELMPGDLVFFSPKADGPGHMGMYIGNGQFVHAPRTGDVVKVSPLVDYARSYMGAVRPY